MYLNFYQKQTEIEIDDIFSDLLPHIERNVQNLPAIYKAAFMLQLNEYLDCNKKVLSVNHCIRKSVAYTTHGLKRKMNCLNRVSTPSEGKIQISSMKILINRN